MGLGLPQSPHPIAPTRMRALKRKSSSSTAELLSTTCSHPACCMETEDLDKIWQHVELSTGGHNGVFLWLMETPVGEGPKLKTPQSSLATRSYRAEVSSNPSSKVRERHSGVGSLISNAQPRRGALGAAHPLHAHRHQAPPHLLQQRLHPPPQG